MKAFRESIEHLPWLPRDVMNLIGDLVRGTSDSVVLIGGLVDGEGSEYPVFATTDSVVQISRNGSKDLACLPVPLFRACAAYFEGEIVVMGGYLEKMAYPDPWPYLIWEDGVIWTCSFTTWRWTSGDKGPS